MISTAGSAIQEPAAVEELQHGDIIHLQPHDVYRHSDHPHRIACVNCDVQVDWVCYREYAVVIVIWHIPVPDRDGCPCPDVCGSTAYDADDRVLREVTAA